MITCQFFICIMFLRQPDVEVVEVTEAQPIFEAS
jgi:hypothetical protein